MSDTIYDVFLSFSGDDRKFGRDLAEQLRSEGMDVFLDEDGITLTDSLTERIGLAVQGSKTLVAYYSEGYASRHACQHELMTAFLAAQREGTVRQRILVINPEPGTDHIHPIELADAKFAHPQAGVTDLARWIAGRARELNGPFGRPPSFEERLWPVWLARHVRGFVGRHRELWTLHTELHASKYSVIRERAYGSFVSLWGTPGSGKTALVANYAWRFRDAFPGGVRWLSLAGAGSRPDRLQSVYCGELRSSCRELGMDLSSVPDEQLSSAVARTLDKTENATLWIVDDLPPGCGPEHLGHLVLPGGCGAHTVLVGQDDAFRGHLPVVRVGRLSSIEADELLDSYRKPDDDVDKKSRRCLVQDLGGNPGALIAVGEYLRHRQGITSYLTARDELSTKQSLRDTVFENSRRVIDPMSVDELVLLDFISRADQHEFPSPVLAAVQSFATVDVGAVLSRLLSRSVATRDGTRWRLDPLVVEAAKERLRTLDVKTIPQSEITDFRVEVAKVLNPSNGSRKRGWGNNSRGQSTSTSRSRHFRASALLSPWSRLFTLYDTVNFPGRPRQK
ncbi:tetratricopeptide repeat protein [Amycolatopsis alba]|uniref:TIR domain-containing protein n=1 Tax=Amycolatopsis alba DSM 44262 TaxID=1125972 RepID=A0A229RMT3_AMYAL|nr:TIR domain-containing protein [Amycolatopsis alba]OXM47885.1 TIR domain-containing protein [Amycolatopsis alba DSM 44262]